MAGQKKPNAFGQLASTVGSTVASNALGGLLSGGGVGGLISGGGIGGALGGLGGAASGVLAAMGPVGWAALGLGAVGALAGGNESRLDKLKKNYKKGLQTGDMSKFNMQYAKWGGAADRFDKSGLAQKTGWQGGAQGQPGAQGPMSPQYQPGNPMEMFQQLLPQTLANPAVFARPEAQQWLAQFQAPPQPAGPGMYANGGPPPSWAQGPAGAFSGLQGQTAGTPGPDPTRENTLQKYLGLLGNGGGQTAPANVRQTMMVNPGKGYY